MLTEGTAEICRDRFNLSRPVLFCTSSRLPPASNTSVTWNDSAAKQTMMDRVRKLCSSGGGRVVR
jgi:hypothetical protein